VFVCKICGEAYIGEDPPSRCPFCGVLKEYFVESTEYDDTGAWDVELKDNDKTN